MEFNEYQDQAERTLQKDSFTHITLINNMVYGLIGEMGELVDVLKKYVYHGHPLDDKRLDQITKECGDLLWYLAGVATIFNLPLEHIARTNIEKLRQRYPDGFSRERSLNREE